MARPAKKENDTGYWRSEIGTAENVRERVAGKFEWDKLERIWNHGGGEVQLASTTNTQHAASEGTGVYVNWIWAYIRTFIPAVYYKQPHVYLDPKRRRFQYAAKLAEARANNLIQEVGLKEQLLKVLHDTLLFGTGWLKVGWYTQFGQVPDIGALGSETKQTQYDLEEYLKLDEGYAYRISPRRILVDPEASEISEARWVVQEQYKPYDLVIKDPHFKKAKTATAYSLKETQEEAVKSMILGKEQRTQRQWAKIWEIWDREENKVRFLVDGCPEFVRVIDPFPYQISGFPFIPLQFTQGIDQFYGPSPVLPWLQLVDELAEIRTKRLDELKKAVTKWMYPPDALSNSQINAFLDPLSELVEADNPDQIQPKEGPKPDPNLYACEEKVKEDIREISGFSELLSGSMPFSRTSATAAATMEKHARLRFNFASERVAAFIQQAVEKLFLISRQLQSYPQWVKLGYEQANPEVEFNKREIEGDFQFRIEVEDMSAITKQAKVKQEYDALAALAPFPEIRRRPLLRDLLHAFGKTDYPSYMEPPQGPPVDPVYENNAMIRGIPVKPKPTEDQEMHLRIHRQFMESAEFRQAVAREPTLNHLFSTHIQETLQQLEQKQMQSEAKQRAERKEGARPQATQNMQRGAAPATSQPVTGQRGGGAGGGAPDLAKALGSIMGEFGGR